ncbi:MAG: L-threonylcarbamoyladenylate synthase [bacterium]|jgi:L-threonylcarbamoyladenylate synthase
MALYLSGFKEENIILASKYIKDGKLVAFPTETVYGLGANALNKVAVAKIFEVKNRPNFDPLIVHIANKEDIYNYVENVNEEVLKLINEFWPGPLTLVLKKKKIIPDIVTAGLDTVAIRIPANEIALKLIKYSNLPIAAPSANPFNYLSPTTAKAVLETIGDKIDIILDGGKTQFGLESTILTFDENNQILLLRPGALEIEKIEKLLNKKVIIYNKSKIISSGQTKHHYKPYKELIIIKNLNNSNIHRFIEKIQKEFNPNELYLLLTFKNIELENFKENYKLDFIIDYLSENNDYYEIASNLFEKLRLADKSDKKFILVNEVSKNSLGLAIMNRLEKATNKFFHID